MIKRIEIEQFTDSKIEEVKEVYIRTIDAKFRKLTPDIVDYKTSKTDERISTIRHGFNILARSKEWEKLKRDIIREKDFCNIDNDFFVDSFTQFLTDIDSNEIINKVEEAFDGLNVVKDFKKSCDDIIQALKIYVLNIDDCLTMIRAYCDKEQSNELDTIISDIRLYKIEAPFVANSSNYGVPQNRERVLFIGCRKDQKFISEIPATVKEEEKVFCFRSAL